MRCLDLFSGIGGFSAGFERAGIETVAFCEGDKNATTVLRKNYPLIEVYPDVRELDTDRLIRKHGKIDIVCGGFPCQNISLAGRMQGAEGEKSALWREMLRVSKGLKPSFIVFENSPVLRSKGLDTILSELHALGYDAEWHCIPLNAIGGPHRRDRIWVIAYPSGFGDRLPEGQVLTGWHISKYASSWGSEPRIRRVDDGVRFGAHRRRLLGNSLSPNVSEMIGCAMMEARK